MDQVAIQFVANAPYAALLFFMLRQVYEDARTDRAQAALERQAMLLKLEALDKSLMMLQMSIENWNTLRRRQINSPKKPKHGSLTSKPNSLEF